MISAAQIIRDDHGQPVFAVLPIAEYQRLIDLADEAAGRRAFDTYRANPPETFPADVADQLVKGEHPVRVLRGYRGLTLAQLADQAGLTQACLAEIEAGGQGDMAAITRIAAALRVAPDLIT